MIDEQHEHELIKLINKKLKQESFLEKPNFPERMADSVAEFGGSWRFIITFNVFFFMWIVFNIYVIAFDPAPFIGLNLILSFLGVVQVPFVLMSQNRISTIDRQRDMRDHALNLKLDLEIQELHAKLDLLIKK